MADTKVKKTTKVVEKAPKKTVAVKETKVKEVAMEVKPAKKEVASKTKAAEISMDVRDITGKAAGKISLPGEIFGAKVNPTLMAQAVRVYLFTQRRGTSSTKTRGEVNGTTKKVYRQKGTGRARHGAAKAPIFVGGGITFGPKPRSFNLDMPKKMRRASLFSALTQKLSEKNIIVFDGKGLTGKTKQMNTFMKALAFENKKATVIVDSSSALVSHASRNLENTSLIRAENLNTYAVLNGGVLLITKESIETLKGTFLK